MRDPAPLAHVLERLENHFKFLYPACDSSALSTAVESIFAEFARPLSSTNAELWNESDSFLITYGDSIKSTKKAPLATLQEFLKTHVGDAIRGVHVLPFCPYSSDDGFSVIDYLQLNADLGEWFHIEELAKDRRIMADLVLNHVSA